MEVSRTIAMTVWSTTGAAWSGSITSVGTSGMPSSTHGVYRGGDSESAGSVDALEIALAFTGFLFALVALGVVVWQCAGRSYARRMV
jgi:hypothetical protein